MQAELIGRETEFAQVKACLRAGRNVLLEGPVGVGKTHLALAVVRDTRLPVFRVDGDNRYSEQKLSGWFDPPTVVKQGFIPDAFIAGPLVEAMQKGGVLFINELNRLPEGVQNVLLPAIDERLIWIPRLGEIRAKPEFRVIATQNPKEFVATSHLSEAILDRFELVYLDYQSEADERVIVGSARELESVPNPGFVAAAAVRLVRATRAHPRIRRGASVRAALSVAGLVPAIAQGDSDLESAFIQSALLALPTRIEVERVSDPDRSARIETETLVRELAREAWSGVAGTKNESAEKKKS